MFGFVLGVGSDELTVKNITSQEKKTAKDVSKNIYKKKSPCKCVRISVDKQRR